MAAVWTVARREIRALFDQPTGYILVVIFVGLNDFLFFRQAFLFKVATLRPMLELLPWLFLVFVPALTMRSVAEDNRSGTLEVVLAQPITELGFLLGKYVGQVAFVWFALALTLFIPLGLSLGADLHAGVIFAQYVGAALLAAGLVGVGVWASCLTKNQITAFITAVAATFALILVGLDPLLVGLPPSLSAVAARLGVLSHFRDIARGVIDLRDVTYFVTLAAVFLTLAYGSLMRRKLSPTGDALKRLRLGVALLVAAMVVLNLFGRNIGGRLDLTPGRAYTLSPATRDLVRNLDDLATITLYVSEPPTELALLRRDIDDLLRDYRGAGGGNVRVVVQDPTEDPDLEEEVRSLGIPLVQFNTVGEAQFTVSEGYLGLAVQYADQTEVIPFIQRTDDLEYRLTSFIRGMADTTRAAVGFYVDPSERNLPGASFNEFRQQLAATYDVRSFALPDTAQGIDSVEVLVLIGAPDSLTASQRRAFEAYLASGGSAFIAASGMSLGEQEFAMGRPVSWNGILAPYGVSIGQDMVYDLISHEAVGMPTAFGRVLQPYPLWIRALSTQAGAVNQGIETIFAPWTSSVIVAAEDSATVTPLFVTTDAGGLERNVAMINPNRRFAEDSLASRVIAALVNPLAAEAPGGPAGRVVVVGGTQMFLDRFFQSDGGNGAFALNAVDWLAQDDALIGIRAKNRNPPALLFSSDAVSAVVRYGNMAGVPLGLALAALLRLLKRRQRTRMRFEPGGTREVAA